jgi:hypothetical protein
LSLSNTPRVLGLWLPAFNREPGTLLAYAASGFGAATCSALLRVFVHTQQIKNGLTQGPASASGATFPRISAPPIKTVYVLVGSLLFINFFSSAAFLYVGVASSGVRQNSIGLLAVQEVIYDKQPLLLVLTALVLLIALIGAAIFMRKPKSAAASSAGDRLGQTSTTLLGSKT